MENRYRIGQPEPKILTRKQQIVHGIVIGAGLAVWAVAFYFFMWGVFG